VCGRYTQTIDDGPALRMRFGLGASVPVRPRWNVTPGDEVLTAGRDGGELRRWGFLRDSAYTTINARAETLMARPIWRTALDEGRCLIVADGFYEWHAENGRKQPYWIARADRAPFAFAGLASPWGTCAIVTTAATERLAGLHARMPVMLDQGAEQAWLSPELGAAEVHALLGGYEDTIAVPVGPAVNDARFDDPACLAPAPEPPPTLF
jgi:putative SOS response-associated peptidase YedK